MSEPRWTSFRWFPDGADGLNVILGPAAGLHPGVHGALRDNPPAGVRYTSAPHDRWFLFPGGRRVGFNPFTQLAASETTGFDVPPGALPPVHSAYLPVHAPGGWVVDGDELVAPLASGVLFAVGAAESSAVHVSDDERRLRERLMAHHYLDARCAGLLFRTRWGLDATLAHLRDAELLDDRELEEFAARSDVVYPALPPVSSPARTSERIRVLYMGRTEDKGGDVAAAAFAALAQELGDRIELVFVGPVTTALHPSIEHHALLDRRDYLELLERCHVYLSPTEFEGFGMGLLEAASRGLAIVTTCGPGMEHVAELFENGRHALLFSTALGHREQVRLSVQYVMRLVEDDDLRQGFKHANLELFCTGRFSLRERDRKLLPRYERAAVIGYDRPGLDLRAIARANRLRLARLDEATCLAELVSRAHSLRRYQVPAAIGTEVLTGGTPLE